MDIEIKKKNLESFIANQLAIFTKDYGLEIDDIYVSSSTHSGEVFYEIILEVKDEY